MSKLPSYILLVLLSFYSFSNDLIRYYKGEIELSKAEVDSLCAAIIQTQQSNYLMALAYYQKGVLATNVHDSFLSYEFYDKALEYLDKSTKPDAYLRSAILKNQGVLLKNFGLPQFAVDKYEKALPAAYSYDLSRGLHVKYNLACAYQKLDREKALKLFLEVIAQAKKDSLNDRISKSYLEISKMFNHSKEHEQALSLIDSALLYADSDELQALIYHNRSHTKYLMQSYESQMLWLFMSLRVLQGRERYVSLMDLGEAWLIYGDKEEAVSALTEAMDYYENQRLHPDNIRIFKWIHQIYPDSMGISQRHILELEKYIETKEKLEFLLKQQAMLQLYLRLESEKESGRKISFLQFLAIMGGMLTIVVFLTWRIWWYRLRTRLTSKILALGKRWEGK